MKSEKKILLLGGAGYIGTVVTEYFLKKGIQVTCLDNLIYKHKPIKKFLKNKNFKFKNCDLRNKKDYEKILNHHEDIVILAGLVGDPITKKYPKLAESINYIGIKNFIIECKKKKNIDRLIFVSTCSNYGIGKGKKLLDEKSPLRPISLYSKQKVKIEKFILGLKKIKFCPTILRFATAFGVSPRMRFDLTINHFTKSFIEKETLKIFDQKTSRPYCHVIDFARSIDQVLKSKREKVFKEVFNIGSNKNNYSKKNIIDRISRLIKKTDLVFLKGDIDKRDYKVNFKKANRVLNFSPKFTINQGIKEIQKYMKINKKQKLRNLGNYIIK